MSDTYNEEESMHGTTLEKEYDAVFDGEERISNLLKLDANAFSIESKRIKVSQIGFTEPVKKGRIKTMTGLTSIIKDLGVLTPIHVMTVAEEVADDDYQYILLDGLRRVYGLLRNGVEEVNALVWDFKDKDQGSDLALLISLLLNRTQRRNWGEIWDLYKVLELQSAITPGTLEYLLQLESGDAMKLKDVMLCSYDEVKMALVNGEKNLDGAYKMLQKLRKEEDALAREDATGVSDTVEGAEALASPTDDRGTLSEEDVLELLEMAGDLDNLDDVDENDFDDMNKTDEAFVDEQKVGERHPLDPALRQAVLQKDNFTCQCCGMQLIGARLGLIAVHHAIPVHAHGKDTLENLLTLCVNCHVLLHIMERNGGSILMKKEDFEALPESEQIAIRKALKLARLAIEADKRRGLSKDDVQKYTQDSIRHPMPGAGLKENKMAYASVHRNKQNEESEEA